MVKPFVIGLAGGTASGKTTLALRYADTSGALVLGHDRYYHDVADRKTFNFDHPDSLDTDLLIEHLDQLRRGEPAELPVYHFPTHRRLAETERVDPAPLLVVEGILVMSHAALRERFDLAIWVEAPADIRLARRVRRDTQSRGRTVESVLDQYLGTVRPMHEQFVAPAARHADLVIDGFGDLADGLARLSAGVDDARARDAERH